MLWAIILIVAALALIAFLLWPLRIPRRFGLERPETDDSVAAYDRTSRWPIFALERRLIMNGLKKLKPHGVLVDIGCGPGYLAADISRRYPSLRVIGLDIDVRAVRLARKNRGGALAKLDFTQGNAQHLPFRDNSLDFLVSSLSLHHWKDAPAALREMRRTLKPGGRLLIWDLRRNAPRFFYYSLFIVQNVFSPRGIRETNGAVGSFWASYTVEDLKTMLSPFNLSGVEIKAGLGWTLVRAQKPD